jgi:hypothetical protein
MLYDCWKHDKRFTDKMWLAFVPGGFLWYYFERFRPRRVRKGLKPHSESPRVSVPLVSARLPFRHQRISEQSYGGSGGPIQSRFVHSRIGTKD